MKMRVTDYHRYGTREIPPEEWTEIEEHCRTPEALPVLSPDALQADYDAYKLKREEAQGYSAPGVNVVGLLFLAMIPVGAWFWFEIITAIWGWLS